MGKLVQLALNGRDNVGMKMTGIERGNAAGKINVATVVDVIHHRIFRSLNINRMHLVNTTGDGTLPSLQKLLDYSIHNALLRGRSEQPPVRLLMTRLLQHGICMLV